MASEKKYDINKIAANLVSGNARRVEAAIQDLSEMFATTEESGSSLRADMDNATVDSIKQHFQNIENQLKNNEAQIRDVIDIQKAKEGLEKSKLKALKRQIENHIEAKDTESQRYKELVAAYKETSKIVKSQEDYNKGLKKGEEVSKGLLGATLGLQDSWSELGASSAKGVIPGLIKGLKETLTLSNIFGSLAAKVVERIMSYDKAQAEMFSKAAISRDRLSLVGAASELGAIGADVQGILSDSAVALKMNMRSFGDLSNTQVKETTKSIAVLSKFGVSMEDSADSFVILTKTLGKTPAQANKVLNNFTAVAEAIGRPPGELMKDFKAAAPILTRFGNRSEKIFKDVALQATNLEMEVSQILNLSEGMDTFEGAAKAAQSFNIAIGQPFLSAQQLLAADPAEKLQMFADAYEKAGRPKLSPRMLRGLGQDLGMPVDQLQRVLKGQKDKVGKQREVMDKATTSLAENAAKDKEGLSAEEKIDAKFANLIDKFVNLIGGDKMLNWVVTKIADNLGPIIGVATILGGMGAIFAGKSFLRGATPRHPEYVRDASGGGLGGGGRGGRGRRGGGMSGKAKIGLAAVAVIGTVGIAYAMSGPSESAKKPAGELSEKQKYDKDYKHYSKTFGKETEKLEAQEKTEDAKAKQDLKEIGTAPKEKKVEKSKKEKSTKSIAAKAKKPKKLSSRERVKKSRKRETLRPAKKMPVPPGNYESDLAMYREKYGDTPKAVIKAKRRDQRRQMAIKFNAAGGKGGAATFRGGKVAKVNDSGRAISRASFMKSYSSAQSPKEQSRVTADYVQPIFNKEDKFYAAKADGPISMALDGILEVTKKLLEQKGEFELSINERKFAAAIEEALSAAQRR